LEANHPAAAGIADAMNNAAEQPQEAGEPAESEGTFRREEPKVGRNDPCPCGSGKKYKQCCGKLS
jgi:preprotein translocase subunit SecA